MMTPENHPPVVWLAVLIFGKGSFLPTELESYGYGHVAFLVTIEIILPECCLASLCQLFPDVLWSLTQNLSGLTYLAF